MGEQNVKQDVQLFKTQPPPIVCAKLSFPQRYVLLVALSRPEVLNCVDSLGHKHLSAVWEWMDKEPTIRVGIITGEGRAFCAGADLKEWKLTGKTPTFDANGFGGLSTRAGRKPVIAAVNGICFGGGLEMISNCDMVVASSSAVFALPEVKIGVVALAGSLPRLVRSIGKQRASELALTGRHFTAEDMWNAGLVNKVVRGTCENVVDEAISLAKDVVASSPDSVLVTREGLKMGYEMSPYEAQEKLLEVWWPKMENRENMLEGTRAFTEKRPPVWKDYEL